MKCTELIIRDHSMLRRGLDILDRMVQIMEAGDRIEIFDIRTILGFLRGFGDEYHQQMEEKILLPALLGAAPHETELHQLLRMEHRQQRELVAAMESALNPRHASAFVRNSRQLIVLLRSHANKEETFLCDIAERVLSAEEDERIAAEFIANRVHSETVVSFARLERKYSPEFRGSRIELDRRANA